MRPEDRVSPFLDELLEAIARDRGCKAEDLSPELAHTAQNILLWVLHAGKDWAYDEPTGRMAAITPSGTFKKSKG